MPVIGSSPAENPLRLAELLSALSLAIDLSMAKPMEWVIKACVLGVRMGEALGLSPDERSQAYYVTLLRHVGCTSTAAEEARLFGDERELRRVVPTMMDENAPRGGLGYLLEHLGAGRSFFDRAGLLLRFLGARSRLPMDELSAEHCEIAQQFAKQLGLNGAIQLALGQTYERWDGHGFPHHREGGQITLSARIACFALDVVFFFSVGGETAAFEMVRSRAGRFHDPRLAEEFLKKPSLFLEGLNAPSLWDAVLNAEPRPFFKLTETQADQAFFVLADFADAQSPYFLGHSRRVSSIAAKAAERFLSADDAVKVRRAALLQGLGRVGVSAAIWGKPEPLSDSEWERVRLYPHHTERVFSRSAALSPLGILASQQQELLDGSGYPHRLTSAALPPAARLLAAVQAYTAMTEARPHRPALPPEVAADELRSQARSGRLDGSAVNAVLAVSGHRETSALPKLPFDLTPRELDVLRLISRGCTNKEMARRLVISQKTVGHHIERLYDKIQVKTRVGATLFAVQNDLLNRSQ